MIKHRWIGYLIFTLLIITNSLKADIPSWATQQLQLGSVIEQCIRETQKWQNDDGVIFKNISEYKLDDEVEIFYGWTIYYLYNGDESVYKSARQIALSYLDRAGKNYVHGYYPYPFYDTEHTLEGLNMLGALAFIRPDDEQIVAALEDLVEHCGNWVPGYSDWFDENTKHLKSFRPGTKRVDDGCDGGIDWTFNLGFAKLALAAFHATENSRYLDWVGDYLDGWIKSMERNEQENGYYVLPAEVNPTTGQLGSCSGVWYYCEFEPGWGYHIKGNNSNRDMRGAFLDYYRMSKDIKYLDALKKHLLTLFENGSGNIPAHYFNGTSWISSSDKVTARMAVEASLVGPSSDPNFDAYLNNWNYNSQADYLMWDYRYNENQNSLSNLLYKAIQGAKETLGELRGLSQLPPTPDDFPDIREIWGLSLSAFGGVLANRGEMPWTEVLYFKENGSVGLEPGVAAVVAKGNDSLKTVYLCNTNNQPKTVQLQANFRPAAITSVNVNDAPFVGFSLYRATVTIPPGETLKVDLFIFDGDSISPLKPVNPHLLSKTENMIHFQWDDPAAAEDGDIPQYYKIYRNGTEISFQDSLDYKDEGLTEGTLYNYNIIAIDNAGNESESLLFSETTDIDVDPPAVENVATITAQSVHIQFSEPVDEQTAIIIDNYSISPSVQITNATLLESTKVLLTTSPHSENVIYSLQISNIKDLATNQNVITNHPTVHYTYSDSLRPQDISRSSYFTRYSIVGDSLYSDRPYVITSIPPQLENMLWIVTANDDKTSFENEFLTFSINKPTSVYIGFDIESIASESFPAWLNDWDKTELIINSDDTQFIIYQKNFEPSEITLCANEGSSSSSMYIILVNPLTTDMVPPAAPTGLRISSR